MRRLFLSLLTFCISVVALHAETTDSLSSEKVGLVLSGGGAKGIAHIGFIQALEENEIPIDYITGTSMGAIVGSLYSIGLSPQEMMDLIKSRGFRGWSSGIIDPDEVYRFVTPRPTSQWVSVNVSLNDSTSLTDILPTRLINPLPMSFAFMELYAPSTGECRGDFNNLMVPFRSVASDIVSHKSVVFSSGQLSDAVRASMSFPIVFQPIRVNGTLLYDGGLYDVYPVDVMMEDFNPQRLIGLNVSSSNTKPNINSLVTQLSDMITNNRRYPFPNDRGVNVRFNLDKYSLLDWNAADKIYEIGYKRGQELADSIKGRISARRSREEVDRNREKFSKGRKRVYFNKLEIDGAKEPQAQYIRYLFTRSTDSTDVKLQKSPLSIEEARTDFFKVASTGRMRNLVPHAIYDSISGFYTLRLEADVDKNFKMGVGGYLTSSAGSMLYATIGYDPFALKIPSVQLEGWAGQNYLGLLGTGSVNFATSVPSRVKLQVALTQTRDFDTEKMFYDFNTPACLTDNEFYVKGSYEIAAGRHGVASISAGYGNLRSRYHVADPVHPEYNGRSHFNRNVFAAEAAFNYNTLDYGDLPVSGSLYQVKARAEVGDRKLRPWGYTATHNDKLWADFQAIALHFFRVSSKFSLGLSGEAFYSTRDLLSTYTSSVINAKAFSPMPSTYYLFDPSFRANQYLAVGIHPVAKIFSSLETRLDAYCYAPMREILPAADGTATYSEWFPKLRFTGEFSVAFRLPFGAIRGYVDYSTSSAQHWSAGISIGMLLRAPKF